MTSERIKFVIQNKKQRGELVNTSHPLGYKVEGKRLVVDPETAPIVQDIFQKVLCGNSTHGVMKYCRENYGINFARTTFRNLIRNPIYIGELYQIKGVVEPIISEDDFKRVQELVTRNIKYAPSGVVYIFTGLLICEECNHNMSGKRRVLKNGNSTVFYRCTQYYDRHLCNNGKNIRQDYIEEKLLEVLRPKTEQFIYEVETKKKTSTKREIDVDKVKMQIERVKTLFINGLTDLETCKKDCAELEKQLQTATQRPANQQRSIERLSKLLASNFEEAYLTFSDKEKQQFWRTSLSRIYVDSNSNLSIFFE